MTQDMISHDREKTSSPLFFVIVLFLLLDANPLFAQMKEASDSELSLVSAQAGISYNWGDSKVNVSYDSIAYSDTDHDPKNWLEFNDVTVSGPDGYFTLDESNDFPFPFYRFNSIDITTMSTIDNQTKTVVSIVDSTHTTERDWDIGHLVFCEKDLGRIRFDLKNLDSTLLNITSRGAGYSGIEFEYLSDWAFRNFSYDYNTAGGSLNLSGIHIAEFASGTNDNPADPATWSFSGQFRIGDIYGGIIDVDDDPANDAVSNPATIDVRTVTEESTTTTSLFVNLPMKGTIRTEQVNFGVAKLGPIAIDGITVHRLGIRLNPGI